MGAARDPHLPVVLSELKRLLLTEGSPSPQERQHLQQGVAVLLAAIHDDSRCRQERLRTLYDPLDPDRDLRAVPPLAAGEATFLGELEALLGRSGYRRLSADEVHQAVHAQPAAGIKRSTQLDDFADLVIFHRGLETRNEVVRRWSGRQRLLSVDHFQRLIICTRFQDRAWFETPARKARRVPFTPGTAILKMFHHVNRVDIGMLLPATEVRLRLKDHLLLAVPAVVGGFGVVLKYATILAMAWMVTLAWMGLREPRTGITATHFGALIAFGLTMAALAGFTVSWFIACRNRKIRFLTALADSLYYRHLCSNGAVLHCLVDEAEEQAATAGLLAYLLLHRAGVALTAAELEGRVQAWVRDRLQMEAAVAVDDALRTLERCQLALKEGERWRAVPAVAVAEAEAEAEAAEGTPEERRDRDEVCAKP